MSEKVSIIIPCFNQGKYLSEAIDSSLNQTYSNIEIICVNNFSEDNTYEILQKYSKKYPNIKVINLDKNVGLPNARNIAIEHASGKYILPLDSDDKIADTYVEKAVNIIQNNDNIGIVYCEAEKFGNIKEKWNL